MRVEFVGPTRLNLWSSVSRIPPVNSIMSSWSLISMIRHDDHPNILHLFCIMIIYRFYLEPSSRPSQTYRHRWHRKAALQFLQAWCRYLGHRHCHDFHSNLNDTFHHCRHRDWPPGCEAESSACDLGQVFQLEVVVPETGQSWEKIKIAELKKSELRKRKKEVVGILSVTRSGKYKYLFSTL